MAHTIRGVNSLIINTSSFSAQEEYEQAIKQEADKWLNKAKEAYIELQELQTRISDKLRSLNDEERIKFLGTKKKDF